MNGWETGLIDAVGQGGAVYALAGAHLWRLDSPTSEALLTVGDVVLEKITEATAVDVMPAGCSTGFGIASETEALWLVGQSGVGTVGVWRFAGAAWELRAEIAAAVLGGLGSTEAPGATMCLLAQAGVLYIAGTNGVCAVRGNVIAPYIQDLNSPALPDRWGAVRVIFRGGMWAAWRAGYRNLQRVRPAAVGATAPGGLDWEIVPVGLTEGLVAVVAASEPIATTQQHPGNPVQFHWYLGDGFAMADAGTSTARPRGLHAQAGAYVGVCDECSWQVHAQVSGGYGTPVIPATQYKSVSASYVVISAPISADAHDAPDVFGVYTPTGATHDGQPVYSNGDGGAVIWWDAEHGWWVVSSEVGGEALYHSVGGDITGEWIAVAGCDQTPFGVVDTILVSGTGTEADGVYSSTGDTYHGHQTFENEHGYMIFWSDELGGWVIAATLGGEVLYAEGDNISGTCTVVSGTGNAPTVNVMQLTMYRSDPLDIVEHYEATATETVSEVCAQLEGDLGAQYRIGIRVDRRDADPEDYRTYQALACERKVALRRGGTELEWFVRRKAGTGEARFGLQWQ